MGRARVTIAGLMGAVLVTACGLAALRSGQLGALRWFYTLTIVILLMAVLAARLACAERRPFWFGFAVFGWAYLVLGLGLRLQAPAFQSGPWQAETVINPLLPSTDYLLRAQFLGNTQLRTLDDYTRRTASVAVGHMLVTLAVALLGGLATFVFEGGWVTRTAVGAGTVVAAPVIEGRRMSRRARWVWGAAGLAALVVLGGVLVFRTDPGPYFPDLVFDKQKGNDEFRATHYGRQFAAMGEPSLWRRAETGSNDVAFRLLWLPPDDRPVAIRIEGAGESVRLRAVILDGKGGFDTGVIALDRNLTLGPEQWDKLLKKLARADYWALPTQAGRDGFGSGEILLFEGVSPGRYHVVEADPAGGSPMLDAARYLAELAGLDEEHLDLPSSEGFR